MSMDEVHAMLLELVRELKRDVAAMRGDVDLLLAEQQRRTAYNKAIALLAKATWALALVIIGAAASEVLR